jgi:hypothetical protein
MRSLWLALVLMAAGCSTEEASRPAAPEPDKPAPAGPVKRLSDPDPAIRAAAREELLALDDLAVPGMRADAGKAENAGARLALLEIADVIEKRTLAVADDWEGLLRNGEHLTMDLVDSSRVPPCAVFLRWFTRPVAEERVGSRSAYAVADIRSLGLSWLQAYTFADFGTHSTSWRRFLEQNRGQPVAALRRRGLIQRGYAVDDPDPNKAARAYRSAGHPANLQAPGTGRWNHSDPEDYLHVAFVKLLGEVMAVPDPGDGLVPQVQTAMEWLELNSGCFAWEGNRLVSRAGAEEYLSVYRGENESLRIAALRELRRWPDRIPKDAWRLVASGPSLVAHAMHLAGVEAPREALPLVLTALGPANDPRDIAKIWNTADLEALVQDKEAAVSTRATALRVLASVDGEKGFSLCTSILKSGKDRPLVNAAALACTRFPGDAGLALAESWLATADDGPDKVDVAIGLARRGRSAGMDLIVKRAGADLLDRRRASLVREFVEGAPDEGHDHLWKEWAEKTKGLAWNAEEQKWKPKE